MENNSRSSDQGVLIVNCCSGLLISVLITSVTLLEHTHVCYCSMLSQTGQPQKQLGYIIAMDVVWIIENRLHFQQLSVAVVLFSPVFCSTRLYRQWGVRLWLVSWIQFGLIHCWRGGNCIYLMSKTWSLTIPLGPRAVAFFSLGHCKGQGQAPMGMQSRWFWCDCVWCDCVGRKHGLSLDLLEMILNVIVWTLLPSSEIRWLKTAMSYGSVSLKNKLWREVWLCKRATTQFFSIL